MKKIITIIFVLCFFASKSQQIEAGVPGATYFDVVPDTLISTTGLGGQYEKYFIDLNVDGNNDIRISSELSSSASHNWWTVSVVALNSNTKIAFGSKDSTYNMYQHYYMIRTILKIFDFNDTINDSNFVSTTSGYLGYYNCETGTTASSPQWLNIGDKYFAARYQDSIGTAFSWVKVNCPDYKKVVVKEFSVGSQIIGRKDILEQEVNLMVSPNPSSQKFELQTNGLKIKKATLYNLSGQEIKMETINNYEYGVSDVAEGVYYLKVETTEGVLIKKVIVSR